MKTFGIGIVLIIWCLLSVIAAVTILGLTLIVSGENNGQTTWMKIGQRLTDLLGDELNTKKTE